MSMMIGKNDKIVSMLLLNPHEGDFTYKRPDSTTYIRRKRKNKEDTFSIPTKQLELSINLPKPPKLKVAQGFPHQNVLERYYGKGWKLVDQNLPPHWIILDTQGMSLPGKDMGETKQHKPMVVKHIPMIEPKLKQELKELINEVLDERYE